MTDNILWILLVWIALYAGQHLLFTKQNMRRLHYGRSFSTERCFAGEKLTMVEVIQNRKGLPVPWLRVESRIAPQLRFMRQKNLEIEGGERYHRSIFFLGPYSQITRRHELTASARGFYNVSSVTLTSGDLLGSRGKSRQQDLHMQLMVYPRLINADDIDLPSIRWQGELLVRRWINPDPFLYNGIREYRRGDSQKDIHWGATARTGQLQVKLHDFTASPRLMVLLNVQAKENQWGELTETETGVLEDGISLAASILLRALDSGLEAGFGSNGYIRRYESEETASRNGLFRRPEDSPVRPKEPVWLTPNSSQQQKELLLETCARLVLSFVRSFPTFIEELPSVTGVDFLILTTHRSEALERRLALLRERGNTVRLHLLEGGGDRATDA